MEPNRIIYKKSTIAYYSWGSGARPVICFHGYGEESSSFDFLAQPAGNQFTFFAIDLPFHGKTDWKEALTFTLSDLLQIVEDILDRHGYSLLNQKLKPVLIGFSLGGRIALSLYQAIPEKIEKLVLLAPDGLKVNFWYWLTTQTWPGNKFFSFTMKHPNWFFTLIKFCNRLKLINTSIFKFVTFYVHDAEARHLLYTRWTCLRKLKPDLAKIKDQIRTNKTPVRLLYGKHDRIILSSVGEKFKKGIEAECTISIIHAGHKVLHKNHIEEIVPALLH